MPPVPSMCWPQLLPHLLHLCQVGALAEGTGLMDVPRAMDVPTMGAPTRLEGQYGGSLLCPRC